MFVSCACVCVATASTAHSSPSLCVACVCVCTVCVVRGYCGARALTHDRRPPPHTRHTARGAGRGAHTAHGTRAARSTGARAPAHSRPAARSRGGAPRARARECESTRGTSARRRRPAGPAGASLAPALGPPTTPDGPDESSRREPPEIEPKARRRRHTTHTHPTPTRRHAHGQSGAELTREIDSNR